MTTQNDEVKPHSMRQWSKFCGLSWRPAWFSDGKLVTADSGGHEEHWDRQEATNENRSHFYGLVHTRLSVYMLELTSKQTVSHPWITGHCCGCKQISK